MTYQTQTLEGQSKALKMWIFA